ncbi:MAG: cytochrome c biogenesis protein CcdA [Cyanothece sp. SIO1E1]|nr:cytochrome c biogenesis protein CcdA [Cyanothece sp. SIO1E1]
MTVATPSAGLAILGGILTVLSPCILPVTPFLVGRSLHSHTYGPVALVIGLISGFATMGSLLGITASWFTGVANGLRTLAIALLLIAGILAIFPSLSYRLLSRLNISHWLKAPERVGLGGEFWLGTQLGLLWTPCAGPVLGSILLLAAVEKNILGAFVLLFLYGLGAGLPLLAIAYGGRYLGKNLLRLRAQGEILQKVGGVMIVATAIAILLGWDVKVQLWLAPLFPALSL